MNECRHHCKYNIVIEILYVLCLLFVYFLLLHRRCVIEISYKKAGFEFAFLCMYNSICISILQFICIVLSPYVYKYKSKCDSCTIRSTCFYDKNIHIAKRGFLSLTRGQCDDALFSRTSVCLI